MSKTKEFKTIPQGEFEEAMEGLVCDTNRIVMVKAPQAYKDYKFLLLNQYNLVEVMHWLQVSVSVKGL